MFVDSHCHLNFPELRDRIDAIRADMAAAQVDRALVICTTLEEFAEVHALAQRFLAPRSEPPSASPVI